MSKVPETCAVCPWSTKVGECDHYPRGWFCYPPHDGIRRIPCRRGALPVPPAWCPKRKEATRGDN